jgi:hypothetical protein
LEEDEETIGGEEEGETDSMFGSDHIKWTANFQTLMTTTSQTGSFAIV